jgi:hypothetical protein
MLPAHAGKDPIFGEFGHRYTKKRNEPVWTIREVAGRLTMKTHGDESESQIHRLSPSERSAFWEKMWWLGSSHEHASCAGNSQQLLCFVPANARATEPYLKAMKSDYFYYDRMAGVMEVEKIEK